MVIRDRSQFVGGFVAGLMLVTLSLGVWFLHQKRQDRLQEGRNLTAVLEIETEATQLAILRAEEINLAKDKYVESCGIELATLAWREAGEDGLRYELLSTFIPFSPPSLEEFMPRDFELVLWDNLRKSGDGAGAKVQLIAGETLIKY